MTADPKCRSCGAPLSHTFIDLGDQPLANSYLSADELAAGTERAYPLHAWVCAQCFLVQVDDVVPADAIFNAGYAYFSSYSASWVAHAEAYAEAMSRRFAIGPDSLVVEVASNDGYLLQHFVRLGVPVLGVEPAANTAEAARARGVATEVGFFDEAMGRRLAARGQRADLMAANNVLAHVPDIGGFVAGFRHALKDEGVLTFEFPHLLNLIEKVQFDTIYHEHFSYLSLLAVERVLKANGLRAFDVERLATHGGSLRLFVAHEASSHAEQPGLRKLRDDEAAAGLGRIETYQDFTARAERLRDEFRDLLARVKAQGAKLAAYGAAAKGNTFLNYAGASERDIACVFDANPHKQGRYLPGSHVPILAPSELQWVRPDYLLILPWNLRDEVIAQTAVLRGWGGRFVTAAGEVEVFD